MQFLQNRHVKAFAQPFVKTLIDPNNQFLPWQIVRQGIGMFFPYLQFIYQYRSGNLKAAYRVSRRFSSKQLHKYRLVHLVKEMITVLDNGKRPLKAPLCKKKGFNGHALFALHSSLPWHRAGYAIRTHHLLIHLKKKGVQIAAITRPGFPWDLERHARESDFSSAESVNGVSYTRIQDSKLDLHISERAYIEGYARHLASLAQQQQSHVIHSASNYLNGLAGAVAARQIGGVSVYEMRGLWHMSRSIAEPGYENSDHYRYCEIMELAAARESHAVVTLSQACKRYLIEKGICDSKIHVFPNAVDTDLFKPIKPCQKLKHQLGITSRVVIGFIGSLTGYEGLEIIVEAVSSLINKGFPLSLVIVGAGYSERKIKRQAAATPATQHIHFVGQVPFEQIKQYYSIVDIFPFPRRNYPVCRLIPPLKILEAMAMEKPVIISNLDPLLEIVQEGKTGLVCRVNDKNSLEASIQTLASNDIFRQTIGQTAAKWVQENRSWQDLSDKYQKLYNNLG